MIDIAIIIIAVLLLSYILFCNVDFAGLLAAIAVFVSGLLLLNKGNSEDFSITGGGDDDNDSDDTNTQQECKKYMKYKLSINKSRLKPANVQKMDKRTSDIILHGADFEINHLTDAEHSDNFSRILVMDDSLPVYKQRKFYFKQVLHWGQLKLMLTEIEFLTIALKENTGDLPIYMVYAGSAPGNHIPYLSRMFPTIYFELYDPNDFVVKDSDMIKTHVQFFTDVDAKYWRDQPDKYVIFCSDIRTEPATEEAVTFNMNMQLDWWKVINPELAMFKFRLPWKAGITEYPQGDIYIQPFPGQTSTETRLIVKKDAPIIEYDNITYEKACFHHNTVNRIMHYGDEDLCLSTDLLDNCYDCYAFLHILKEYISAVDSDQDPMILAKEIQKEITVHGNINTRTRVSLKKMLDYIANHLIGVDMSEQQLTGKFKKSKATHAATMKAYKK